MCLPICGKTYSAPFNIPDPEEVYEAYSDGFIDYEEYRALLEISRGRRFMRSDSLFLLQFPDLLTGFSSNPLFTPVADTLISPQREEGIIPSRWNRQLLYRQYQKLTGEDERKRLFRFRSSRDRLTLYGEYETEYSGAHKWGRRYLEYSLTNQSGDYSMTVGSYKDRFGLGLIYGYHGQLLDRPDESDDWERLLYPRYGGSNGVIMTVKREVGEYKVIYDTDRNEAFGKDYLGFSVPLTGGNRSFQLSGGYGRLRNRANQSRLGATFLSMYGRSNIFLSDADFELAIASFDKKMPVAGALYFRRKRRVVSVTVTGWHYDGDFPSWFSGGPSSRRYRTISPGDIGLSVRDRFAGETGGVVKTTTALSKKLSLHSALGYAWRGFDDNRVETRLGVKYRLNDIYRTKVDCYLRSDGLYSGDRSQRRIQYELVRDKGNLRSRIVFGHRFDRYGERDDYLVYFESRLINRLGRLRFLCKLDRLRFDRVKNNYVYVALSHETEISGGFSSYIKYSYRYRRGQPGNSYGMLRWDFSWAVK